MLPLYSRDLVKKYPHRFVEKIATLGHNISGIHDR